MGGNDLFFQAFVYLAAAVISVPIARRFGLGSVLGYLIAGVVIGPFALGLVGREGQDVLHFAEFGVVMMLFLIGLELQPAMLWRLRSALIGLGGLQVAATALVLGSAAALLGLDWRAALAIGLILSLSSTAIVLQSLTEKGLAQDGAGERSFAVLLFQDIAVIPMLAVLPLLATASAGGAAGAASTAAPSSSSCRAGRACSSPSAPSPAIALAGQFLVRPLFRFIARSGVREVFTAAALLLVVAIALLMRQVGLSPALGTFLGGVVLANSEYRHELESDIEPFKGLLLGLFFIAVGASIDFGLVAAHAEPRRGAGGRTGRREVRGAVRARPRDAHEPRPGPALRGRARPGRRVLLRALLVRGADRRARRRDGEPAGRDGGALDGGDAVPDARQRALRAAALRLSGGRGAGARTRRDRRRQPR